MKKRIFALFTVVILVLSFCSCSGTSKGSTFSVRFIDVGQGDSALIECDGQYMLIDGGTKTAGDKIYNVLQEEDVQELAILAVSHLHEDHYGGLLKALTYASSIGLTISNNTENSNKAFKEFEHQLGINGSKIKVPAPRDTYKLGSATVEVLDVSKDKDNDSLVLLIGYEDTRFLFTGDIEGEAQSRLANILMERANELERTVNLIKMPHHGAYNSDPNLPNNASDNSLYFLLNSYNTKYAIISVGAGNSYGHPHRETLDMLSNKKANIKMYRTDKNGDILVKSNGKELFIYTSK